MQNTEITIEQLAEKLHGKLWVKGDMKRIYLDRGHNTKKMTTKTYIYQREDGSFGVSCHVDCPSQPWQWCKSQEEEVKESVYESIERSLATEVFYLVDAQTEEIVDVDGKPTRLNDLYEESDYFYSESSAAKAINESSDFLIAKMDRDEFDAEVERLDEIERNMSVTDKLKRGDDILIHGREDLAEKTEEIKSSDLSVDEITGHFAIGITGSFTGSIKIKKDGNDLPLALAIKKAEEAERERVEMERKRREEREQRSANDKEKEKKRIADLKAKAPATDNVFHSKFGTGAILNDDGKIIEIDFHENGVKKLVKKFANLTKIGDND